MGGSRSYCVIDVFEDWARLRAFGLAVFHGAFSDLDG